MRAVEARGLTARLDRFQLGPIDLALETGEVLALLGPSGAGKTTFLRAIAGFLDLSGGTLEVAGRPSGELPPERRGIGYVPQGLALIPHRTVEANLAYPLELRSDRDRPRKVEGLLAEWGLTRFRRRYPAELSGGERQRVAMARAMAAEPELLLWDEPLAALDPAARHELVEVIAAAMAKRKRSLIVVTHDAEIAFSVADRFLLLDRGRAVVDCDAPTLARSPPTAFAARLVGYENVWELPGLTSRPESGLRSWLLERSGEGGVAFTREAISIEGPGEAGGWPGRVLRSRWTPAGPSLAIDAGGIVLEAAARATAVVPRPGSEVRVSVDPERTVRLPIASVPGVP